MSDNLPLPDDREHDPEKPQAITIEQALEVLEKGAISQEHGAIRWSSNYTFLTSLCYKDVEVLAVYKPQTGERPLWDFPDGTLCYRERAAFLTSDALEWELVPPTVLRDGARGLGSFQLFIDHDPDYHYFSFDESMLPQLMKLSLFDYLVNNADRKGGHCLVDSQAHLWGIDHGITFHSSHKLRTVIWNFAGHSIPEPLIGDISQLCKKLTDESDTLYKELSQLLHPAEMKSFIRRVNRVLSHPNYPEPGPGPNYPWPPV